MIRTTFAHCDGPLPFAPGTSPFHIKGEMYRQLSLSIDYYGAKSNGRVVEALDRAGLTEFLAQPFLSSAQYDALPLPRVPMAIAQALGRDVIEVTRNQGQAAVKIQMEGVYSAFLTSLSTRNFTQLFPKVINHLYDFAPVEAAPLGKGEAGARLIRRSIPLCVAEWWTHATTPFIVVPLEAHGASEVSVEWRVDPRGFEKGLPVADLEGVVRWRAVASRESGLFPALKTPG
jgi:hypothetical protein